MRAPVRDPADEAVAVVKAAARDAVQYGDDSVALGVLMMTCRLAGYPLAKPDAKAILRAARKRPDLRVVR